MMPKRGWKFYLLCGLLAACSRGGSQPKKSAPPGGLPPLDQPEDKVHAPELPPGHPPLGAGADLPGQPPAPGPVDPSKVLSGLIKLSPKVKAKVQPGDVLFLSVRKNDSGLPGPILAVDRLAAAEFPIPFSIDGSKAMVAGTQFAGKVIITARLDKDGDAMTKSPGDVEGKTMAEIPQKHVVVTLDTVLP